MEASNHGLDLHGDTLGLSRCKIQGEPLYDPILGLHFCCQLVLFSCLLSSSTWKRE